MRKFFKYIYIDTILLEQYFSLINTIISENTWYVAQHKTTIIPLTSLRISSPK